MTSILVRGIPEDTIAALDALARQAGVSRQKYLIRVLNSHLEEVRQMASTWVYSCKLGLAQGTCARYEADKSARGYGQWAGCPSCKHREPDTPETIKADSYHSSFLDTDDWLYPGWERRQEDAPGLRKQ